MLPSTILCIALLSLASCQYDDVDVDVDGLEFEVDFDRRGLDDDSGYDEPTTTTLPPSTIEEDHNPRTKYAIFGGILGGLAVVAGLAVAGRRLCARSKEKKDEEDDKDNHFDYDYYGIIHRRMSSSYV